MHTVHLLATLRHRDFRWFFTADAVNRVRSSMTPVALAFAVLHIDNSPVRSVTCWPGT